MNVAAIIEALGIPSGARVDQRVAKKLLLEQGAPTAGDKRHIQEGIDELYWVAALKPSTISVPAYRDEVREYLEIAVLTATFRPEAKGVRLTELIHRAIPYPLLLTAAQGGSVTVSLASKRFSQMERSQVVLDGPVRSVTLASPPTNDEVSFRVSLAISDQPARDLFALYQGWLDRVAALEVARLTGAFILLDTQGRADQRRAALDEYVRLHREVASLRTRAASEKQMNRRVDFNLERARLEAALAELTKTL